MADRMMKDLNYRLCVFEGETGDVLKKYMMNKHVSFVSKCQSKIILKAS